MLGMILIPKKPSNFSMKAAENIPIRKISVTISGILFFEDKHHDPGHIPEQDRYRFQKHQS